MLERFVRLEKLLATARDSATILAKD
jgi:hypothetical protein